ncbi:hypothetical protein FD754_010901 [Muntiacus muntjak]|uniref:LRAT domain-containing protein n=1 Tax=Muntiacus muntjak TaxID=9888 RepID=A0A5N3X0Z0_MUNMU|nr:hypothetical protein FD754_010901 [Muntiacus muntjak]
MRQELEPGALGRPRGIGWRGRWEGGSGWGTHVNPWLTHVNIFLHPAAAAKSLQSCPTLCDPIDGSPPGSPVPGILQARTLEWSLSRVRLFATPWTAAYQALPSMGFSRQEYWSGLPLPSAWDKPKPRPGDLIEIFRIGYEHWAIYVEDDCVVHLASPSEEFEAGSITSVFSNRAVVKYSRLEDVLHGCSWKVNNKLDGTYLPLPVDRIIQRTKKMINRIVQYSLIEGNCEHFVNDLRYGVPRSQQVEHVLMQGAKAAGAVLSAVVDSIRPKSVTA